MAAIFARNVTRVAAGTLTLLILGLSTASALPERRDRLPYRPRWVTVLKKGKLFKYKRREFSSPRIVGDRLYVGSDAGYLYAIRKQNGRKAWRFRTEGPVNSSPVIVGERLFFGDDKGILYALDLKTGKKLWSLELGSEILTEPAAFDGRVFVATVTGRLVALRDEDGEILWDREHPWSGRGMTIRGNAPPLVDEETKKLYVGWGDGVLSCLKSEDGRIVWEKAFSEGGETFRDIDMKPLLEGDRLYLATFEGKVVALSKKTGGVVWSQPIGSGVGMISNGDRLIVSGSDGVLYALAKSNGAKLWERPVGEGALTAPVVYRNILAVGLSEQTMNFFNAQTGRPLYRRFAKKGIFSDPVIDENKIYYLSNGGRLYSLKFVD